MKGGLFGRNRKGQIFQVVFVMSVIFFAVLMFMIFSYVTNLFFGAVVTGQVTSDATTQAQIEMVAGQYSTLSHTLDYGIVILLISLTIGLIITSFLIPSHPIFLAVNVLGIFILVLICMALSNAYGEIITGEGADAGFASMADQYPISVYVMQYLPYISVVIVGITTIVMFAKWQSGAG